MFVLKSREPLIENQVKNVDGVLEIVGIVTVYVQNNENLSIVVLIPLVVSMKDLHSEIYLEAVQIVDEKSIVVLFLNSSRNRYAEKEKTEEAENVVFYRIEMID